MAAPQNSYTDFPNGVTSFGIPVLGGGPGKFVTSPFGRTWFVNASDTVPAAGWSAGSNGFSGTSPGQPFLTMAKAFEQISDGDVINFTGRIGEQLVTPVQVFDVWINGCGNRPRNADATPLGGRFAAAQWGAPTTGAVAGQATLRVLQQGWRFTNFLWTMQGATAAGLEIVRNAGAGDLERDGSHASVYGCRFAGAGIGIRSGVAGLFTEIAFNVEINDCDFNSLTTAMSGINGNGWKIRNNRFWANTNHIVMALQSSHIYDNIMGSFTTGSINLAGGGGLNVVTKNFLSGTYSSAGGYTVSNANDEWAGNFGNTASGITIADPA